MGDTQEKWIFSSKKSFYSLVALTPYSHGLLTRLITTHSHISLLCSFPSLSIEESEGKYSLLIALFCHGKAENKIEKFSMPSNFAERKCVLQNL
jgi:hypothetical protein